MTDNLLDMLKSQLGGAVAGQLGNSLGVGEDQVGGLVEKAGATLLGGLLSKAATPSGPGDLMTMLKGKGMDGSLLNDLGGMLGSPAKKDDLITSGDGIVGALFGDKLGAVLGALGPALGLAKNAVGPLLSMIAPLLMSLIGKQVATKGLDVGGLLKLLMGQKDFVKAALPAGLPAAMGIANLADLGKDLASNAAGAAGSAVRTAERVGESAAQAGSQLSKSLLPLIGLAIGALLLIMALNTCSPKPEPLEPAVRTEQQREVVIPGDAPARIETGTPSPLPGPGSSE